MPGKLLMRSLIAVQEYLTPGDMLHTPHSIFLTSFIHLQSWDEVAKPHLPPGSRKRALPCAIGHGYAEAANTPKREEGSPPSAGELQKRRAGYKITGSPKVPRIRMAGLSVTKKKKKKNGRADNNP